MVYKPRKRFEREGEMKASNAPNNGEGKEDFVSKASLLEEWVPKFIKEDGKPILKGDLLEDQEVCLALARGLSPPKDENEILRKEVSGKQLAAEGIYSSFKLMNSFLEFSKMFEEKCLEVEDLKKEVMLEKSLRQLAEIRAEAALDAFKMVNEHLSSTSRKGQVGDQVTVENLKKQVSELQEKLELTQKLKENTEKENVEMASDHDKQIRIRSAHCFRLGWTQATLPKQKREIDGPVSFEQMVGLEDVLSELEDEGDNDEDDDEDYDENEDENEEEQEEEEAEEKILEDGTRDKDVYVTEA